MHDLESNYRFYESDMPLLAISHEHFGGGQQISETEKTYPYGMELENLSTNGVAEAVRIRIRILRKDHAIDDHWVEAGDIHPTTSKNVTGTIIVPADYTDSQVVLLYQQDSRMIEVNLRQNNQFIDDSKKTWY